MGRKHSRQGKYILFFVAALIISLLAGCTTLTGIKDRYYARRHISRGTLELSLHNFDMAVSEHLSALSLAGQSPPADEALFAVALIFAHQDNPEADYDRALQYLQRLYTEFPDSRYAEDARSVASLIRQLDQQTSPPGKTDKKKQKQAGSVFGRGDRMMKSGKFNSAAAEYGKFLKKKGVLREEALFKMGLLFAHESNPDKDYARSMQYFSDLTEEFPDGRFSVQAEVWKSVLNVIEEAKKVDIEIEKKKKELNR